MPYTAEQLNIKAPAGGFQDLGWYPGANGGSYQYHNGTFGENGSIHPESPQQGAGQVVSEEINRQTSIANGLQPNANQDWINRANQPGTPGATTPTGGGGGATSVGGVPIANGTSTIDLMAEQQKLFDSSGIVNLQTQAADIQASIDAKNAEADKRRAEVNENPWLSESSRVGRIAKIDQALNDSLKTDEARLANIQTEMTNKRNEINDKLGLQLKQYDLDRVARQDNFNMLNSLLSSGALLSATDQDIANLAANAGVPVSFVKSMRDKSKERDLQISTETDAYGNVTVLAIDKATGEIVSQNSAGRIAKGSSGSGSDSLSPSQERVVIAKARTAIKEVDDNEDALVSAEEYMSAVSSVMDETGISEADAAAYIDMAMEEYGINRWNF